MPRTPCTRGGRIATFRSDLGWVAACWIDELLARLTFGHASPQAAVKYMAADGEPGEPTSWSDSLAQRLQAFAGGDRSDDFLDIPLFVMDMTPFQQAVIERCRRIPSGETLTYGGLAAATGHPGAARAVGRVMATNRFPLIVPCHRVVAAGGAIGGFSAPDGIEMKRRLLAPEAAILRCE
ncbi:MAG: MGMT family protein [Planctomycetes bacterium]|nr:MGMT family protein [Planctomycetota bacterium]